MIKCTVCGKEGLNTNYCESCGTQLNLDYPDQQLSEKTSGKTTLMERLWLPLFSERIRKEIIHNNYTFEAILIMIITYIIYHLPYFFQLSHYHGIHYTFVTFINFLFITTIIVYFTINVLVVIFSTFLIGKLLNKNFSFSGTFRIYSHSYFLVTIVSSISLIVTLDAYNRYYLIGSPYFIYLFYTSLFSFLIAILLIPISYKTLFYCSYLKAFIIYFVVSLITFPVYAIMFQQYVSISI